MKTKLAITVAALFIFRSLDAFRSSGPVRDEISRKKLDAVLHQPNQRDGVDRGIRDSLENAFVFDVAADEHHRYGSAAERNCLRRPFYDLPAAGVEQFSLNAVSLAYHSKDPMPSLYLP